MSSGWPQSSPVRSDPAGGASQPGDPADADLHRLLPSTWGDIVGIDPVEEDRLIGLNGYVTGKDLQRGLTTTFDQNYQQTATRVPVITPAHVSLPGQVTMSISLVKDVDVAGLGAALDEMRRTTKFNGSTTDSLAAEDSVVDTFTAGKPSSILASDTQSFADLIQPLRVTSVEFHDGKIQPSADGGGSGYGRNVHAAPVRDSVRPGLRWSAHA